MRLLLLLLWAVPAFAEVTEPVFQEAKTCYKQEQALAWPFRCERYEFAGAIYWIGFSGGKPWRVERETPAGGELLWLGRFVYEREA